MEDWRKWVDTTWEKFHRIAAGGMQAEVSGTLYVMLIDEEEEWWKR